MTVELGDSSAFYPLVFLLGGIALVHLHGPRP